MPLTTLSVVAVRAVRCLATALVRAVRRDREGFRFLRKISS
jgi:hypothetical protein